MLELILERSGTLNEQDFVDKLADFGSRPPAQRVLYMQGLTTAALGKLTRPGAWLLDYVYTVISVIYGDAKPSVLFTPGTVRHTSGTPGAMFPARCAI